MNSESEQKIWEEAERVLARIQPKIDKLATSSFQWDITQWSPSLLESIKRNSEELHNTIMASIITGLENLESSTIEGRVEYLKTIYNRMESGHLRDSLPRSNSEHFPFLPILISVKELIRNQEESLPFSPRKREIVEEPEVPVEDVSQEWAQAIHAYLENRPGGTAHTEGTLDALAMLILDRGIVVQHDIYGKLDEVVELWYGKDTAGDDLKKRKTRMRKNIQRWLKDAGIPVPHSPETWKMLARAIRRTVPSLDWGGYFSEETE